MESGDPVSALSSLEEATSLAPHSATAYFQLASLLFNTGRMEEAKSAFLRTAELVPDLPEPHQNLGLVLEDQGQKEEAFQAFERAAELAPDWPDPWLSMGSLLTSVGKNEEAIQPLRKAMELSPDDWRPPFFLGNALLLTADPVQANMMFERATGLPDASAEAFNNRGRSQELLAKPDEAIQSYRQARQMDPEHFRSAINLASLLSRRSGFSEAEDIYRIAIRLRPESPEGYAGLGNLLHVLHRYEEAVEVMLKAVEIQDDDPETVNHLAFSLSVLNRFPEAKIWYDRLLELQPDRAAAYVNYSTMFEMMERGDEAVLMLRQALKVDPDYSAAYPLLAHAKLRQCSWENLDSLIERVSADAHEEIAEGRPLSAQPFALLALPMPLDIRLEAARQMARAARDRVLSANEAPPYIHHPGEEKPRLRLGYISPDFRSHSVGICFQDLLKSHDRNRFEVFGYHIARKPDDDLTDFYQQEFDEFRNLRGVTPFDAAKQIHDDKVDILVDLAGHTGHSRYEILALKPAPLQVHFLGYGATTGADYIDYLVTDHSVMTPEAADYCDEALAYLPDTFMPASRYEEYNITVSRADEGLPEEGFVFANFNAHYKFDPEVFSIWMRLLRKTPGSLLWVVSGSDKSNLNLKNEAQSRGIDPDRIIISERTGHVAHLARHQLADLGLDNYFHAGGVTTIDALWAGLPVLTMRGPYPNSRTGVGIVKAAGLPELIADDKDHYSKIALEMAASPDRLRKLRDRLANRKTEVPLFDMSLFARYLEQAYSQMWSTYSDGRPPGEIRIKSA